jgi:hypothetical protein
MSASPANTSVPPLILAIITAAIHCAYQGRLRVVAVMPTPHIDWAREGRRDIFASHRIR